LHRTDRADIPIDRFPETPQLEQLHRATRALRGPRLMQIRSRSGRLFITHLSVSVDAVRAPAARFHLVRVQPPKLQLLLEQRSAHICRVVQLSGPGTDRIKNEMNLWRRGCGDLNYTQRGWCTEL
jgi:hypothetical protein